MLISSHPYIPGADMNDIIWNILAAALLFAAVLLYLLPTLISGRRRHLNDKAVIAVNVLLGWTIIGWVVALTWALSSRPDPTLSHDRTAQLERLSDMKSRGDLTQEEFDQEKRRIMST